MMRKSEMVISIMLAIIVLGLALALQRNWAPSSLKEVASTAEQYVLAKTGLGGYPGIPGFDRILTYSINRQYRAALFRSKSVSLGFAPGRLVIYNKNNQSVFSLDTLEGARDAWTALYDFAGRRGAPIRGGRQRSVYTRDLTGDGKQDIVIGSYSGGNRCCTTLNILEIEKDSLKSIDRIEGLDGWPFDGLDIRRIGRGPSWELVIHQPQITACGTRDDAADLISIYAYADGEYKDQTGRFSDFLQGALRENLAKWSREKNPSLGLLQTLAVQMAVLNQPDRAKKFFEENLPRFLPQLKQQGLDPGSCKDDLGALVDRLAASKP